MNILIVANSHIYTKSHMENINPKIDMIIAADGGANLCRKLHIVPDIIIGDLDSITEETRKFFKKVTIIHQSDQDTTDLEKALAFSLQYNPATVYLTSLFGNRLDHSFANVIILEKFVRDNKLLVIVNDPSGVLRILPPGVYNPEVHKGDTVSFFSFSFLENLELRNFKYNILAHTFQDFFLGVSNEYEQNKCYISFSEGVLFWFEKENVCRSIPKK